MTADLIVLNACIHTMDPARPRATALAVAGGRIVALGSDADMAALAGPGARRIDAGGRAVLPGFQDAHVHMMDGGLDLIRTAQLYDAATTDDIARIMAAHNTAFTGALVAGAGWQPGFFGDHNLNRELLDRVVPDRPCIIYDANFHNACLNSAACRMAGIGKDTPDPPNGHIVRGADGEPTGMLHEEAIVWALTFLPATSDADWIAGGRAGQAHAHRHGITGIIDPVIADHHRRAYAALAAEGALTMRVAGAAIVRATDRVEDALARVTDWRAAHATGPFRINAAKFFLDGGLENRTAAMVEPYADAAGGNGRLMYDPAQICAFFTAFDAARFQIHVHCIGDLAVRAALDGFQAARAANGDWPSLHQIAHVQVTHPADRPRFAALGVMANMQPLWAAWDPVIPDHTMALVGPARQAHVYAFRSLIDAGAPWCISSDFPVTTLNPFEIIETAVTRQTPNGRARGEPFGPAERIAVAEAVLGYTRNAAAACWRGGTTGVLAPGRMADLIILDRDILMCEPQAIGGTTVLLTLVGGQEVHRAAHFDG